MTNADKIHLCEGIAEAMLINLEHQVPADPLMLTHAVRDLANLCAEQQRAINDLCEVHGS
jgi:hypothetical protein